MQDPRLDLLDAMADDPDVDGGRIYDTMIDIGSNLAGLRTLVDRYASSDHPLLPGYVAMALARAVWDWEPADPALCGIVLDFIDAAGTTTHPGALATTCGVLEGLNSEEILHVDAPDRRERLARFLLHCLDQDHVVAQGGCIDLLNDLETTGTLQRVLASSAISLLKERLAHLAAEDREELRDGLASLRTFWAE
jgi:hypothetical protein